MAAIYRIKGGVYHAQLFEYEDLPSSAYDNPYERCPVCYMKFLNLEKHLAETEDEDHTVYAVHES